jgi:ABC-type bacteriocin/lantibiotic exporter with double-glycine peptidase domain
MLKEYYKFIKRYFELVKVKTSYLVIAVASAFFYKGLLLLLPIFASWIIRYLIENNAHMTFVSLAALALVYLLYNISLYINYKIYGINMWYVYGNLQTKILAKLTTVDEGFTKTVSKGRLMNSVNADVIRTGKMNDRIAELSMGVLQIAALLGIVAFFNVYLAILMLAFALAHMTIRNLADRKVNIYHRKVLAQRDKYSSLLTQVMSGMREIKTFNMMPKLIGRLDSIQDRYTKDYLKKRYYWTIRDNDARAIHFTLRAVLYVILIIFVQRGYIDVSILVLVIMYKENLVSYIHETITASASIREISVAMDRVDDILSYDSGILRYGNLDETDIYGSVEFKNVSLNIEGTEVLKNVNLKIGHNQVVAIVGEAGCGKTVLFDLMLRLRKPTKGMVKIDNIDIFEFSKRIYAQNVSVVSQKPFIFNMSIRKNLDFADTNIKNQIEACKEVSIHDFIMTLPDGYNTILRENATNISGGQKQMISIARTILSDAEILLLDDITTALDPDTAKAVPRLVEKLKDSHTIIMITKKPDLMARADKIIVMDKGKIVDTGSHAKLMKTSDIYKTLQSRKSPSKMGVLE